MFRYSDVLILNPWCNLGAINLNESSKLWFKVLDVTQPHGVAVTHQARHTLHRVHHLEVQGPDLEVVQEVKTVFCYSTTRRNSMLTVTWQNLFNNCAFSGFGVTDWFELRLLVYILQWGSESWTSPVFKCPLTVLSCAFEYRMTWNPDYIYMITILSELSFIF
jgi:hypothetical protein